MIDKLIVVSIPYRHIKNSGVLNSVLLNPNKFQSPIGT